GVIGDPIEHSLSPPMQNAAFRELELDYAYLAFRVPKELLKSAILGMAGLGIVGLNVTIPHKLEVMKYLDHIDEDALLIGAVNTVVNRDGELIGYNTDGIGAVEALERSGIQVKGKRIAILGAGGGSRAVAFKLAESARSITILNRTKSRAVALAKTLGKKRNVEVKADRLNDDTLATTLSEIDLLVNATSIGMWPNTGVSPIKKSLLPRGLTVFDIVYNPVQTQLLCDASEKDCRVVEGVDMLVYQGAAAFELWTGTRAPIEAMRRAVMDNLRRKIKS
ncbi:MAG: shikimate dehydrogenase, partial [Candidatus Bathyarchaeota archaeon]